MRTQLVLGVALSLTASAAAQDMPLSQILIPGEGWKAIPYKFESIGGLAADSKGRLYASDPKGRRIVRFDEKLQPMNFAKTKGEIAGITVEVRDIVYGIDRIGEQVMKFDVDGKEARFAKGFAGRLVQMKSGRFAFAPDRGFASETRTRACCTAIALTPDKGTLALGVTVDEILAYRAGKDGQLDSEGNYYYCRKTARGEIVHDLAFDPVGRLYVAAPGGLQVVDPTGRLCGRLSRPETLQREVIGEKEDGNPAEFPECNSIAIGGSTSDTLFAAYGKQLFYRKIKTGTAPVK